MLELLDVAVDAPEPMPELLVPEVPFVAVDDEDSDEGLATEQDDGEQEDVIDEADDEEKELWLAV